MEPMGTAEGNALLVWGVGSSSLAVGLRVVFPCVFGSKVVLLGFGVLAYGVMRSHTLRAFGRS